MRTLKLHLEAPIQGEFNQKELNLLFTFQVNCPGCFSHGFPLVAQLQQKYQASISFLGLSTAFEDFEFNNHDNTRALVEEGRLVGETLRMFRANNVDKLPFEITVPIAMDAIADQTFDYEKMTEEMCEGLPNSHLWSIEEKAIMKGRVKDYLLGQKLISLTFTLNQFQGTPTFVLFNEKNEILVSWFGHKPFEQVVSLINQHSKF